MINLYVSVVFLCIVLLIFFVIIFLKVIVIDFICFSDGIYERKFRGEFMEFIVSSIFYSIICSLLKR